MRISSAGLAVLTVLAVAACGGSSSTTSVKNASSSGGADASGSTGTVATVTRTATVSRGTSTVSSSTTPGGSGGTGLPTTTGPTAGTTTGTPTPTTGAGAPPCTAAVLALSFLGGQGATGHGELGFALRNTGASSCATIGYPGVQFLDRSGAPLPTNPTHTTSDFFGPTGLRALSVAPGQSASFRLGVSHNGPDCTTAYGLQVIAPNDTATLRVDLPGGASECGGDTTVSPMQAGDSAYR